MRFRHCFDCCLESRSSFFVNIKFNGKLTFALAGVCERYVWCFCSQLQLQLLCIAIVIYENIYLQAINRQNLYVAKMSIGCGSKQLQIQMSLQLTKFAMKRGLQKFHAGFPRSCCLTISYSKRKIVTYINVYMSPYFWFWNKKSIYFNKKTVRSLKFKSKANQNSQSIQNNRSFAWWRHFTTMTRILQGFAILW